MSVRIAGRWRRASQRLSTPHLARCSWCWARQSFCGTARAVMKRTAGVVEAKALRARDQNFPSPRANTLCNLIAIEENMIRYREIAFVAYPVTDMARARKFYEGVLGLKPNAP